MNRSKNRSFEIAGKALENIRANAESATPLSFELWYTHISGANPLLSSELKKALEEQSPLNEQRTRALHERFFANDNSADEVLSVSEDISAAVTKIIERLSSSGDDFRSFSGSLVAAKDKLQNATDAKSLWELVGVLAQATDTMTTKSEALEKQLAIASIELQKLRDDVTRVREQAFRDGLTGVGNRKRFDIFMKDLLASIEESKEPACLILGDVDHFKSVNDRWGHQVGDQVLKFVAAGLSADTKGRDLVARYGGEEFAVVLPNTSLNDAKALADKLRTQIAARRITRRTTNEIIGHVTISFGVAQLKPREDASEAIERADACLYQAKRAGRNRVVTEADRDPGSDV